MHIVYILLLAVLVFFTSYFTVKSTVQVLLNRPKNILKSKPDLNLVQLSLIQLKDIGVLNNEELEDIIEIYETKGFSKKEPEQYLDYFKILNELKELEYFSNDVFNDKMSKLKKHYKAD